MGAQELTRVAFVAEVGHVLLELPGAFLELVADVRELEIAPELLEALVRPSHRQEEVRVPRSRLVTRVDVVELVVDLERPIGLVHVFMCGGERRVDVRQERARDIGSPGQLERLLQVRERLGRAAELQQDDGHPVGQIRPRMFGGIDGPLHPFEGLLGVAGSEGFRRLFGKGFGRHRSSRGLGTLPRWRGP